MRRITKKSEVIDRLTEWAQSMDTPSNLAPEHLFGLLLTELEQMEIITVKWADEEDEDEDDTYCGAV